MGKLFEKATDYLWIFGEGMIDQILWIIDTILNS